MTDEELMRAYIEGDSESFQALYERHKGRVLGFLGTRLGSREEAEEVFQEVFLKLHAHRTRYREDVPFVAWLFTIARNAAIDHIRKKGTQEKHVRLDLDQVNAAPDERTEEVSIAEAVSELSSLSAAQRQVLELRFDDGLSFADIAERIEATPANARKMVSRALQKLRGLMSGKER